MLRLLLGMVACVCSQNPSIADEQTPLRGFRGSAWFDEQVREAWLEGSARVIVLAPGRFDPERPTRLIVFATPNGNSIEQTLGSARGPDTDWHFDIQHVAAQVRRWREVCDSENVVVACIEPAGLSWPAWRRARADSPVRIRRMVDALRNWLPEPRPSITLAAHSGGGSFLFGLIDAGDEIPTEIDRIVFLDANYAYADDLQHGDKLLAWLRANEQRRLAVIAYDDREITLDGQKVVSPTWGTFRATQRMRDRLSRDTTFVDSSNGAMLTARGLDGRIVLHMHANPENKILHTALVGEMNGLLEGLSIGRDVKPWGALGGPRAYTDWIQPAAGIPSPPIDAPGARALVEQISALPWKDREEILVREFLRGNMPNFQRQWRPITVTSKDSSGKEHTATFRALPDYLSIGSDGDFLRWPMTPQLAQRIADAYGASLPTRKMVDDITRAARVRMEPVPLTKDREAVATFVQHHELIEAQWGSQPRGTPAAGMKKDVVITNRLAERPHRVAIYGWHHQDGTPIQPLTIVHVDWYVDYSHGVRLVHRTVDVDGRPRDIRHVLQDAALAPLLSDEGPVLHAAY